MGFEFNYGMYDTAVIGLGDIGKKVCDEFLKWDNPDAEGRIILFKSYAEYKKSSYVFDICFIATEIQSEADLDEILKKIDGLSNTIFLGVLLMSPLVENEILNKNQSFIVKLSKISIHHVLLSEKLLAKSNVTEPGDKHFFAKPECLIHYVIGSVFNFTHCIRLINHNIVDLKDVILPDDDTHKNTYFLGLGRSKNFLEATTLALAQLPSDYFNLTHRQYLVQVSRCAADSRRLPFH